MFTVEMLIKEFERNNWRETFVKTDTDDIIVITPCSYLVNISSVNDCSYFLMDSDVVYLYGHDNIESVVHTLNTFAKIKQNSVDEEAELREFYNERLRGATDSDWELARTVYDTAWNMWREHTDNSVNNLWAFADAHMSDIALAVGLEVATAEKAFNLACDGDTYSDWYKDVYGHRPRF